MGHDPRMQEDGENTEIVPARDPEQRNRWDIASDNPMRAGADILISSCPMVGNRMRTGILIAIPANCSPASRNGADYRRQSYE